MSIVTPSVTVRNCEVSELAHDAGVVRVVPPAKERIIHMRGVAPPASARADAKSEKSAYASVIGAPSVTVKLGL